MAKANHGKFVISLDFELMWGVRDKKTIAGYGASIKGVHTVIPGLLEIFNRFNIKGTFSTVGFLFFRTKQELLDNLPSVKPMYADKNLSPYENNYLESIDSNYETDPYHFAPGLIDEIKKYKEQEIGTHTFSHYYCLEEGQTLESFSEDLTAAIRIAEKNDIKLSSLIFPRNQFNESYLKICADNGITCFRGNEHSWIYAAKNQEEESNLRRALRLLDAYINISGHNCYSDQFIASKIPMDIPSSRFLRPYSSKLSFLDGLRLRRIKSGMTHAAKNNLTYHLWWHPHNFGINQNENFSFLEKILGHYEKLNKQYNFTSYTMSHLANLLKR